MEALEALVLGNQACNIAEFEGMVQVIDNLISQSTAIRKMVRTSYEPSFIKMEEPDYEKEIEIELLNLPGARLPSEIMKVDTLVMNWLDSISEKSGESSDELPHYCINLLCLAPDCSKAPVLRRSSRARKMPSYLFKHYVLHGHIPPMLYFNQLRDLRSKTE
jgi:hypothetical protein